MRGINADKNNDEQQNKNPRTSALSASSAFYLRDFFFLNLPRLKDAAGFLFSVFRRKVLTLQHQKNKKREAIDQTAATPEIVWAAFRELAASQKETARLFRESKVEMDERQKETDRLFRESKAEMDERQKETDRLFRESKDEMDKLFRESKADYDKRMKNIEDRYGSQAQNLGSFAEEYFYNSFEKGNQNFFGEKFDDIDKQVKGIKRGFKDEYDIVLFNCASIAIVEVKFKAHENDLPKIVKKAETFRINYPDYANHQIYLGLASMSFYPALEDECVKAGIAIVKQVGDTVVISDEHLKAF